MSRIFARVACLLASVIVGNELARGQTAPAPMMPPSGTFRPGEVIQDCPECPEMVVVPAGSAALASGSNVTIAKPFAVGKFEVTFAEWDACVSDGGCMHRPDDRGWGRGSRPVILVSWTDAQEFVSWLSRKTSKPYRLLSEAEWEYAAQGGSDAELTAVAGAGEANCNGCGSRWDFNQTAPAGSFGSNAYGLHDMLGNVWEWTADCWSPSLPDGLGDGSPRMDGDCNSRIVRGGCFYDLPRLVRSAHRPARRAEIRIPLVGFRIARTL